MHDELHSARDLPRERGVVESRKRAECFQPRRDVGEAVRMHRSGTTVVTRVQRSEEFAHLSPTTLTDHQAIGLHPQRLTHEPRKTHRTGAFEIRLASLQGDMVRMVDDELRDILNRHDALGGGCEREERRQQRRLPHTGGAAHEEVRPSRHGLLQEERLVRIGGSERHEVFERGHTGTSDPDRDRRARRRDRRQDHMDPESARKPHVDARMRVIHMPIARGDECRCQLPHFTL